MEQSARQQAEASAAAATNQNRNTAGAASENFQTLTPKPRGSAGDGFRLIEEMGLGTDKLTYNAIVV